MLLGNLDPQELGLGRNVRDLRLRSRRPGETGTIALTVTQRGSLIFQLFKNDWAIGPADRAIAISLQFDGGKWGLSGLGRSHDLYNQGQIDTWIEPKNANALVMALAHGKNFTVEFPEGMPSWSSLTPGDGEVIDKFVDCVKRIGGVHSDDALSRNKPYG